MDQTILVKERIDAGEEFVRRFDKAMPVKAAFWLMPSQEDRWFLYVASDQITAATMRDGLTVLHRVAREMRNPDLDPFGIRLLKADDPLTLAAMEVYAVYPGPIPIRYDSWKMLGGIMIEGGYFYPMPSTIRPETPAESH